VQQTTLTKKIHQMSRLKLNTFLCAAAVATLSAVSVNTGKVQAAVIGGTGNPNQSNGYGITPTFTQAESFSLTSNDTVQSVNFWGNDDHIDIDTWDDQVTYSIYTNAAGGGPGTLVSGATGTVTATYTADGKTIAGNPEYEISFNTTPISLSSGTTYWLALTTDSSTVYWDTSSTTPPSSFYYSGNGGSSWSSISGKTLAFQVNDTPIGSVPEPLTTLGTVTGAGFGIALRRIQKQQKQAKS